MTGQNAREAGYGPASPERAQRRLVLRFAGRFLGLVFLFSLLVHLDTTLLQGAASGVIDRLAAEAVALTMTWFLGADVAREGATIVYHFTPFQVVIDCTGIELIGLFLAAVLAFPSPWHQKMKGLMLGVPLLTLLNLLRMVTLVWVGAWWPETLDYGHVYVWPGIVLATALGIWLHWAGGIRDFHRAAD